MRAAGPGLEVGDDRSRQGVSLARGLSSERLHHHLSRGQGSRVDSGSAEDWEIPRRARDDKWPRDGLEIHSASLTGMRAHLCEVSGVNSDTSQRCAHIASVKFPLRAEPRG